jgi:hypothetical protein
MLSIENPLELIQRKIRIDINNIISKRAISRKSYRVELALKVLDFLLEKYFFETHDIKGFIYLRNMAIYIEEKQYEIFNMIDFMNKKLFSKRLEFVLLNLRTKFYDKVDTNSIEFKRDSTSPIAVNFVGNYSGYGIYYNDDGSFILGTWENGWLIGKVRYYDKYYNIINDINDFDFYFDFFLQTLV